jgi:hypothetical protein
MSHVGSGFQIANGIDGKGRGAAKDGGRYSIHDIVLEDVQPALKGLGIFAQISTTPGISASPRLHDVKIDHVIAFAPLAVLMVGGPATDPRMSGLSITNSIFTTRARPVISTGGGVEGNCSAMPRMTPEAMLRECFSSYSFHHNIMIGVGEASLKDNRTVNSVAEVGFSNYKDGNHGNYHLSPRSKFRHAAADQKDVGPDLDAIEQATVGVR